MKKEFGARRVLATNTNKCIPSQDSTLVLDYVTTMCPYFTHSFYMVLFHKSCDRSDGALMVAAALLVLRTAGHIEQAGSIPALPISLWLVLPTSTGNTNTLKFT